MQFETRPAQLLPAAAFFGLIASADFVQAAEIIPAGSGSYSTVWPQHCKPLPPEDLQ